MEYYDWERSASKKSLEKLFRMNTAEIPHSSEYIKAVDSLMNEGKLLYLFLSIRTFKYKSEYNIMVGFNNCYSYSNEWGKIMKIRSMKRLLYTR